MPETLFDSPKELDRLFAQVERRSVFRGTSPDAVSNELDPDLADAMGYTDLYEQQAGPSPRIINGTFVASPVDDPDSQIDASENELPGWTYVASGSGTWVVTWLEDTDGPDGASIEFTEVG